MLSTKLKEAAGNSADATLYVNDVFSTWLYTGTGATQTITNGIDLAGKGGLVWIKYRNGAGNHRLFDTARPLSYGLITDDVDPQALWSPNVFQSYNSDGFTIGSDPNGYINQATLTAVSWTFRKAAKFFDVVTYTGTGSPRTIAHSLGVAPGMIIVKRTDSALGWPVYHRGLTSLDFLLLDATSGSSSAGSFWDDTNPTATNFTVGGSNYTNASGGTYVAYLFAHDTSSTGIIQCGSFTTGGSGYGYIDLPFESQYVLMKRATGGISNWEIGDIYRGMPVSGNGADTKKLFPNLSSAETGTGAMYRTGMNRVEYDDGVGAGVVIYMAIRMPNKPPTSGTQVFGLNARTGTGAAATVTGGQTDDAVLIKNRGAAVADLFSSRLTGTGYLVTSSTAAEVAAGTTILQANPWDVMDGVKVGTTSTITNASANTFINYLFKRAPGFFDEVCYTGTSTSLQNYSHNLQAVPEMMIVRRRNQAGNYWFVYHKNLTAGYILQLESTAGSASDTSIFTTTAPTASVFTVGGDSGVNSSAGTYVAYLFATLAGISKVGSYTGNGTGQAIACGFSAGARFVLIKRTNAAGDWYTFDSARDLTSGSSPYLLLNSTAAETTGNNGVYASTGGFTLGSTASTTTNINAATYIFLAVA